MGIKGKRDMIDSEGRVEGREENLSFPTIIYTFLLT